MSDDDPVSVVGEIISRSKEAYADGWGFATLRDVLSGKDIKIVGSIDGIHQGMTVCVEGIHVRHERYGLQIKIERIWEDDPRNEDGMISWMTKRLPQIGPKRAADIVRKFGVDQMFHVIEYEPYKLTEIDGITKERADEIVDAYRQYKREQETFIGLYRLGFSKTETNRIMRIWQTDPLDAVQKNPFELYGTVKGFTFDRLDEIRIDVGLPDDHPPRLCTALVARMKKYCQGGGHTVRDFDDFVLDVADWVEQDEGLMMEYLGDMVQAHQLSFFGRDVQLYTMAADEDEIATKIKELLRVGQRRRAVGDSLGGGRASGAQGDGGSDEEGGGNEEAGSDRQALADADPEKRDGAQGAAPSLNPDDSAFHPGYWGRQGAGIFAGSGRRSNGGQEPDAQGADGSGDRRPGDRKDNDSEADA